MKCYRIYGLIVFYILFLQSECFAQLNLVPNPSFENYSSCPTSLGKIKFAIPWDVAILNNSSDYFNTCNTSGFTSIPSNYFGHQSARTGNAYAGIITYSWNGIPTNYREYIQVELLDTLQFGVEYCLRFFVSPGDSCRRVSNDFGAYFANAMVLDSCGGLASCTLPFQPQIENPASNQLNDRNLWIEISGSFVASGGEKYLLFGNFKDATQSTATLTGWSNIPGLSHTYYYIDDVLLSPCDSLTGIENINVGSHLTVFPTIAEEILEIKSDNSMINSITIWNIMGEKLIDIIKLNQPVYSIDVSGLSHGMYIVLVSINHSNKAALFMKN